MSRLGCLVQAHRQSAASSPRTTGQSFKNRISFSLPSPMLMPLNPANIPGASSDPDPIRCAILKASTNVGVRTLAQ